MDIVTLAEATKIIALLTNSAICIAELEAAKFGLQSEVSILTSPQGLKNHRAYAAKVVEAGGDCAHTGRYRAMMYAQIQQSVRRGLGVDLKPWHIDAKIAYSYLLDRVVVDAMAAANKNAVVVATFLIAKIDAIVADIAVRTLRAPLLVVAEGDYNTEARFVTHDEAIEDRIAEDWPRTRIFRKLPNSAGIQEGYRTVNGRQIAWSDDAICPEGNAYTLALEKLM